MHLRRKSSAALVLISFADSTSLIDWIGLENPYAGCTDERLRMAVCCSYCQSRWQMSVVRRCLTACSSPHAQGVGVDIVVHGNIDLIPDILTRIPGHVASYLEGMSSGILALLDPTQLRRYWGG
ncbi:hypothetical protein B0H34DRAFT_475694 [Crassisporium funariophilum]|nr:hypothetical protein B0H34DRAFT_475694 [Crassisporium funariophilum]